MGDDLEEGVTGKILKFADNTKLFRKTKEIGDNFFYKIQFSLFPAHINISYSNNNMYILCRKRGGQKTMLTLIN